VRPSIQTPVAKEGKKERKEGRKGRKREFYCIFCFFLNSHLNLLFPVVAPQTHRITCLSLLPVILPGNNLH
jgi:hypothetical protein